MHLLSPLTLLAAAATASAVLVPPSVSASKVPILKAVDYRELLLDCPDCPVLPAKPGNSYDRTEVSVQDETKLRLMFTVDKTHGRILLNDRQLYPVPAAPSLAVFQNVYDKDLKPVYSISVPISAGIDVHPLMQIAAVRVGDGPVNMVPARRISLEILGLMDRVVKVDTVELTISDVTGDIIDVSTTPYASHATAESDACRTVLCRARAAIRSKLAQMLAAASQKASAAKSSCARMWKAFCSKLGMPGSRPSSSSSSSPLGKIKGGVPKFTGGRHHNHHRPGRPGSSAWRGGRHHGYGQWRHRHHRSGLFRSVVGFFRHVVAPVFVGIAVGLAVSGVGMLLGQAVVYLFVRAHGGRCRRGAARCGRGRRAYESVAQEEEQERESFDELPKYEEAPGYEDAPAYVDEKKEAVEEVEEKKDEN